MLFKLHKCSELTALETKKFKSYWMISGEFPYFRIVFLFLHSLNNFIGAYFLSLNQLTSIIQSFFYVLNRLKMYRCDILVQ